MIRRALPDAPPEGPAFPAPDLPDTELAPEPDPRCARCGGAGGRTIPAYWGPVYCETCSAIVAQENDRAGAWPVPWWDVPADPSVGVVGPYGPGVALRQWRRWDLAHHGVPEGLGPLLEVCERLGVRELWIHRAALEPMGLPAELTYPEGGDHFSPVPHRWAEASGWEGRAGLHTYMHRWRRGGEGVHVNVPAWAPGSPFDRIPDERLHAEALAFKAATGAPWRGRGSITSDAWIREAWRRELAPTLLPPAAAEAREAVVAWHEHPATLETVDTDRVPYCVALDQNAAFAASSSSVELPTGTPEHSDWPRFDKSLPGFWLLDEPPPDCGTFPAWPDEGEAVWVTTPTMELAAQRGREALEAWTWPEHRRYLRPWYESLREGRHLLSPRGGPAFAAVKEVAVAGLGRLGGRGRARALEEDPLYQPYWRMAVVAEHRARLWRLAVKIAEPPIAVHVDCLYWLTTEPDPAAWGRRLGLTIGTGGGQWKAAGRIPAAQAVEALSGGGLGRLLAAFGHGGRRGL